MTVNLLMRSGDRAASPPGRAAISTAGPGRGTVSPQLRWLAVALIIAVIAALVGTASGRETLPAEIRDAGALVRWGHGVAKTEQNVAAAATIGALVFAAFIVPPVRQGRRRTGRTGADPPQEQPVSILRSLGSWCWLQWRVFSGRSPR